MPFAFLRHRSQQKELLDADEIPRADLYQNLQELDRINTLLGGYNITFSALRRVLRPGQPCTLIDIGCGGGDTLKHILRWQRRSGAELQLIGIDLKPDCIAYAEGQADTRGIRFICDDYRHMLRHVPQVDIIHACLFCHHLDEDQLIGLLRFAAEQGATLIINDLERHPLAYWSIKALTGAFSQSYLVRHDAPLSVARGFKKREWRELMAKAGSAHFSIRNRWAFRHEIIVYAK